jgi:F-type H+-transporting ATPase subunit b
MIRKLSALVPALVLTATPLLAQNGESSPLDVNLGLMIWTVLIFVLVLVALAKFAWPNIIGAVEKREAYIRDLIASAERDRAEAAAAAEEQRRQVEETRARVQEALNESRSTAERMRAEILEQARREHEELLTRARADIAAERASLAASLRTEAVDVAIAAAEKLVQKNLDGDDNRRLVQQYLAGLDAKTAHAVAAGA